MQIPNIALHGAESLRAQSGRHEKTYWLSLGEYIDGRFSGKVTLFFDGPDAKTKTELLELAINGAMTAQSLAPQQGNDRQAA